MRNASSHVARIAALIAIILTFPLHAQQSLDDLVRTAHFIFIGDVVKLGSTTMRSVAPSAKTAVARVQDVLTLEPMFGDFRGRDITVELRDPQRLEKTLFFTNIAVYGTSLDAIEVAHQSTDSADRARSEIRAAERRNL